MRDHHRQYAQQAWLVAQQQWATAQSRPADLRIGDAERTAVTEALNQHYAEGRLEPQELEERLDATLAAKTGADLHEVMKDLPGPRVWEQPVTPPPGWQPRRHRHRGPRFLVAPLLFMLLVLAPVAAVTSSPWLFFGPLRILFLVWIGMMVFAFLRRRIS